MLHRVLVLGSLREQVEQKADAGGWPYAFVAFSTNSEILFVSYVIMLANLLSDSDLIKWADTIIACTGGNMHGAYVD
jgi:hypothetical protein